VAAAGDHEDKVLLASVAAGALGANVAQSQDERMSQAGQRPGDEAHSEEPAAGITNHYTPAEHPYPHGDMQDLQYTREQQDASQQQQGNDGENGDSYLEQEQPYWDTQQQQQLDENVYCADANNVNPNIDTYQEDTRRTADPNGGKTARHSRLLKGISCSKQDALSTGLFENTKQHSAETLPNSKAQEKTPSREAEVCIYSLCAHSCSLCLDTTPSTPPQA
jgi:hypothetical protein